MLTSVLREVGASHCIEAATMRHGEYKSTYYFTVQSRKKMLKRDDVTQLHMRPQERFKLAKATPAYRPLKELVPNSNLNIFFSIVNLIKCKMFIKTFFQKRTYTTDSFRRRTININ